MSGAVTVESAPGKLYIAGEYAVVEPGEPAVLVALDRYVTVEVSSAQDVGRITSAQYAELELVWRRSGRSILVEHECGPYSFVLSALRTVEELVGDRGLPGELYDVSISSQLDDVSGRKFGLGSSAAVTVATVRALNSFYRLSLTEYEICKASVLASVRVSPSSSGGDVAASTLGGWVAYRSPDRDDVLRLWREHGVEGALRRPWPGFGVERLPEPADLDLYVGWTGTPASTEELVGAARRRSTDDDRGHDAFVARSRECVLALTTAIRDGDGNGILLHVAEARQILRGLAARSGLTIETPDLTALCDSAEAIGASAKSSGAGGGDCGIALAPRGTDVADMLTEWEQHDIRLLSLAVHENDHHPDDAHDLSRSTA